MLYFHNDYPLADPKAKIKKEMMSKYKLQIREANNFSIGRNKKLIPNLANKTYELHYLILKLCLDFGLKLKSIKYENLYS